MSEEMLYGEPSVAPGNDLEQGAGGPGGAGVPEATPRPTAPRPASLRSGFVEIPPGADDDDDFIPEDSPPPKSRPPLTGPMRHARPTGTLAAPILDKSETLTPAQRLLILDTWQRSGLPAGDFAGLVGVSRATLFAWKKRFEELGPSGLMDHRVGGARAALRRTRRTAGVEMR